MKCKNCTREIWNGTKHLQMPNGWCQIINQPIKIKATKVTVLR